MDSLTEKKLYPVKSDVILGVSISDIQTVYRYEYSYEN